MDRYKLLRNTVVNMLKQSKRSYFKGLRRCGTKQFWKAMKSPILSENEYIMQGLSCHQE